MTKSCAVNIVIVAKWFTVLQVNILVSLGFMGSVLAVKPVWCLRVFFLFIGYFIYLWTSGWFNLMTEMWGNDFGYLCSLRMNFPWFLYCYTKSGIRVMIRLSGGCVSKWLCLKSSSFTCTPSILLKMYRNNWANILKHIFRL